MSIYCFQNITPSLLASYQSLLHPAMLDVHPTSDILNCCPVHMVLCFDIIYTRYILINGSNCNEHHIVQNKHTNTSCFTCICSISGVEVIDLSTSPQLRRFYDHVSSSDTTARMVNVCSIHRARDGRSVIPFSHDHVANLL